MVSNANAANRIPKLAEIVKANCWLINFGIVNKPKRYPTSMAIRVNDVKYFVSSPGMPNALPYVPIASPAITSTPTYKNIQKAPNHR